MIKMTTSTNKTFKIYVFLFKKSCTKFNFQMVLWTGTGDSSRRTWLCTEHKLSEINSIYVGAN